MRNVIYYHNIIGLGGTTTYEYELIKKYHKKKDIVLFYKTGDKKQIAKLRELIDVREWNGEEVECDTFFTNYEFSNEVLNKFKAKKYYQVVHAMFKTNKVVPRTNEKFDKYICVSQTVLDEFKELTGLSDSKLMVSHNPLSVLEEETKPILLIGTFSRLSWEKGSKRMEKLISRLDKENIEYLWFVYTNDSLNIRSDNVFYHKPVMNPRRIMATMDIIAQLSDCEGDNYTTKESKMCNKDVKLLVTPIKTFYENKIIGEDDIVLDFDMSNIDEVIEKIKNVAASKQSRISEWKPLDDEYDSLFVDSKSKYKYVREKEMKIRIKIDRGVRVAELEGKFFGKSEIIDVKESTAKLAISKGWADEVVEIEKESQKIETKVPKKAKKKE